MQGLLRFQDKRIIVGQIGACDRKQRKTECGTAELHFQCNSVSLSLRFDGKIVSYHLLSGLEPMTRHLSAEERRAATVEAVIGLAAEQNSKNLTTTAIAQRMGLTQGALFRHFPTKDAILQAVVSWVMDRLLSRVDKAAQCSESPVAALEAIFMTHINFISEHPGVPKMLFGELQRPGETLPKRMLETLIHRYSERLQRLLEAGIAQGEFDAGLDSAAAALFFVGAIQGLVMQAMMTGDIASLHLHAPRAFAIYCRGIEGRQ
jgi:TetR/AcrR family transcriptional regulator